MLTKDQLAEKLKDLAAKVATAHDYLANEADLEDADDRNMVVNYVAGIGIDVDRITEAMEAEAPPIKVIIEVSGGNVQNVWADLPNVKPDIRDWDNATNEGGEDLNAEALAECEAIEDDTANMHHVY